MPRGNDFRRGQRSRHAGLAVSARQLNNLKIKRGGNDELRSRQQRHAGGFRIENGTGAQQQLVAEFFRHFFDHLYGVGNGHGDFEDADIPGDYRLRDEQGNFRRGGAHNRHQADFANLSERFFF